MNSIIHNCNEHNKDILIISLFEYICEKQNLNKTSLYENITNHQYFNDSNFNFDITDNKAKNICISMINEIIDNTEKNLELECLNNIPIQTMRYANDFIEVNKINSGGFGVVYKTMNKLDLMTYAIKKIPIKNLDNKVLNEAKILANLKHNNIIRYYSTWIEHNNMFNQTNYCNYSSDSFEFSDSNKKMIKFNTDETSTDCDDLFTSESNSNNKIVIHEQKENNLFNNIIFIQMEVCKMTLKDYILQTNSKLININNIIRDILSAVKYIHAKNIIHCDLSLINILVDENDVIKICDFGLAEDIGDKNYIIKNKTYGNLIYCAPESIQHSKYSYKSDIYSLGIIIFELLNKFKTEMERLAMIKKFKNKELDFKYSKILYSMININENVRPYINDISIIQSNKIFKK